MNIAFIGLGNMGGPMATNLLKAGFKVTVFDLVQAQCDELAGQGAKVAESAPAAAKGADVVVSMLPAGQHVRALYTGDQGIGPSMGEGTLVIDSSTIDEATAREVAEALADYEVDFVDAPVSGGVAGAQAGTLTFIVGGSDSQFARAKPVLEAMGKNIFHAGDHGAGQVAKICNNMLLAVLMAGTSEALQLGISKGLDPKVLSEIIAQSSGGNWTLDKYNPCPGVMESVPSSNNYDGGFLVDLMCKDLGLALDSAVDSKSSTPMGALARSLYAMHSQQGWGRKDFSSIFQMFNHSKEQ
ncbi:3-hydroxyisobutyrate dehydrogenase [Saliniradius amylolyticus]|uniref:3-hydroxyisobutyrate dehydrogenase n=1 Tax=Saliniradius amylolyticus TaxID=2183582 RepID=A0A2S2E361_9ALTE|nr:3-hydroxyisobutyrate dehydrogenase [Saliniradius amylolyticus]AWL12073.1 3-hydroxyisobutyrate dehydrogenase [Saliniradius amylolyticus]